MNEEFEFQDLSGAVFWGVDLRRTTFRDVDLTGARISHTRLSDVVIDATIDGLVVNGVDVTTYVNDHDEWFGLRSQLYPTDVSRMAEGWTAFRAAWGVVIEQAENLTDEQRHASVGGEWSLTETLRHLVFGIDKWFTVPILGGTFHPTGLPNSGSVDFAWPGIDVSAAPTFGDAVEAWCDRAERLGDYLEVVEPGAVSVEVEVLENGTTIVHDCVGVVFEEHFQHLRYATRDLDRLG